MSCKRLQIFRAGTHTASNGRTYEFTEQMLRDAVAAYDPKVHEAPIVVGHPRHDLPAYGWVRGLTFSSDRHLEADPDQIDPAFADLVAAGRFKKISAAFYMPDSPSNPKPGTLYLRHVGCLGAQPPAIKGLRSAAFSDSEQGVVEFGDWADSQNATLWRRMREFIIEKFGREDADKALPDWDIKSLEDAARVSPKETDSFTEPQESHAMTPEQIAAKLAEITQRETALQTKETAFAERETQINSQQHAQREASNVSFIDALVTQGKFLPAMKTSIVAFMSQLDERGVVEFGEGDAKQSKAPLQLFQDYLAAQPKLVEFREVARADGAEPLDIEDAEAIAKAAVEFQESEQKSGRFVDTVAAVQHVIKQRGSK